MNNIIHSFDLNSSSSSTSSNATTTTTTTNNYQALLSHFCSWQRSRKMMAKMFSTSSTSTTAKNSSSSTSFVGHQINPINNLCYQSVSINNNNNNDHNQQKFPHQTFVNRKYMIGRNNNKSNPIVSFLNKGDGKIAVNFKTKSSSSPLPSSLEKPLVILQNDNQLYSMDILMASSSSDHHRTSESNCYATLEPPTVDYNNYQQQQQNDYNYIDPNDPFSNESWYYGTIEREHAIHLIENCPTGSFIVRKSITQDHCYALTIRVPYDYNYTGIAHYLIQSIIDNNNNDNNNNNNNDDDDCKKEKMIKFKIKGFQKEFPTISSLIIHHSIMKEQLPCTLRLIQTKLSSSSPLSSLSSTTSPITNNTLYRKKYYQSQPKAINNYYLGKKTNYYNGSIIPATTKSSSSSLAMYGSSTYRSNWNLVQSPTTTTIDDRMVDVDLDPTYQRILENFRKAMAHCN
ncbi:uncharacterized protein LOC113795191 [Dermatophagoides pteronyssinus]|uniref:uncharacterized protein LOC113795191 n=1 Tax=Dermatophagoides pteronyssinus TaxID=6956 RepID=UPI003F66CECD